MKIYIVSSRYGENMYAPEVFKTRVEAENHIKEKLADMIYDDFSIDMEHNNIDVNDHDAILQYADMHDYVTEYNNTGMPDSYIYGSCYLECMITEVDI